jgi:hypothetical protein
VEWKAAQMIARNAWAVDKSPGLACRSQVSPSHKAVYRINVKIVAVVARMVAILTPPFRQTCRVM